MPSPTPPLRALHPALRLACALAVPFVALGVQWLLWDYIAPYVWFLFFPAAFFSAWISGLAGGVGATLISALLVWYFFIPTVRSFAMEKPSGWFAIIVFVSMGCLFAWFHARLQLARRQAEAATAHALALADDSASAAQASDERFRRLFDEAPVPLCFVRSDGVLAAFNRRFETTFGYGPAEVPTLADWWLHAYPDPAYRAQVLDRWSAAVTRSAAAGGDITPAEYRVTCRSGEVRTMLISGITLGDDWLATFFDLSERKLDEEVLREQAEELKRRNEELERFNRAATGREMVMIKLKQEINALSLQTGRPAPYPLEFLAPSADEAEAP